MTAPEEQQPEETGPTAEAPSEAEATPAPAAAPAAPAPLTTDIVAGQGGVMTDEVGVVTGDLTLRSELSGSEVVVRVQYKDADEWYVVTGAKATLHDPADLEAVHAVVVGILNRPEG
ncbi:hypothetical protein Aab01nite_59290 [Paractinoplanes abujensis]|uniref:Uncharacterized protein n=1 Tax=Paractinoplanes abujensis TaxID=882441 RepID=A0A7W7CX89_9ACTN|nr:hypothetical protein [Actinoplanes abujensis]MBB4696346.1 hypothetical protein [Actinoplanes abujensis]GID22339.1 hypothetical protein Aab01nite_59290 [Actinoplanes abujensis]